jgi:hypothetical protein
LSSDRDQLQNEFLAVQQRMAAIERQLGAPPSAFASPSLFADPVQTSFQSVIASNNLAMWYIAMRAGPAAAHFGGGGGMGRY